MQIKLVVIVVFVVVKNIGSTAVTYKCRFNIVRLTKPTPVGNNVASIIINRTFSNIVLKIRLRHLISGVNMYPEIICTMIYVRTVHPLTVNIIVINVITSG